MCGIVYVKSKEKNVANSVWKKYKKQKSRGSEGFGFVSIKGNTVHAFVRVETEKEAKKNLDIHGTNHVLFHHRLPTSVPNIDVCNHPLAIVNNPLFQKNYYLVHNGVIYNAGARKRVHEKEGIQYQTIVEKTIVFTHKESRNTITQECAEQFNDSEALLYDLAMTLEGYYDKIEVGGTIAFVLLQTDKQGVVEKLYYGRNSGNPLCVTKEKKFFSLTSEGGQNIEVQKLFSVDLITGEEESRHFPIPINTSGAVDYPITTHSYPKSYSDFGFYDREKSTGEHQMLIQSPIKYKVEDTQEVQEENLAIIGALQEELMGYRAKYNLLEEERTNLEDELATVDQMGFKVSSEEEWRYTAIVNKLEDLEVLIQSCEEELSAFETPPVTLTNTEYDF